MIWKKIYLAVPDHKMLSSLLLTAEQIADNTSFLALCKYRKIISLHIFWGTRPHLALQSILYKL